MRSFFESAGPQAARIESLWWLLFFVCAVIFLLVVIALIIALARRRAGSDAIPEASVRSDPAGERRLGWFVGISVGATVSILFVFVIASAFTGQRLASLNALDALTIRLTGYRWWWKIEYLDPIPARQVITANEIHIPVGRPVLINTHSQDVIHSFWIPPLHGKRDLIPGHPGAIWIQADKPGRYEGQCAEFCGLQHAHMRLLAFAEPEEQFQSWLETQRRTAQPPQGALAQRGHDFFMKGPCALCHSIRGTEASGQVAPDLTHFASRATIAAGTLSNTTGHLAGWIVDSQRIKPGNAMPPSSLSAEDLQALLAYLRGLA
jgi:cytochrome c oxidase subunit 2